MKVAAAPRTITWKGLFGEVKYGTKSVYGIGSSMTRDIPMGEGRTAEVPHDHPVDEGRPVPTR